jgi:hypothetical protein
LQTAFEADVIYTFWVKSAICTDRNCRREVPLFKDYIIAQKTPKIRYHRDATCPACRKTFDWEVQVASLIAEPTLIVNAPRGSGGEGRPTTLWSYAPEPPKPKKRGDLWQTNVPCPHCQQTVRMQVPNLPKFKKSVVLTVLLCPSCESVWEWRGPLPEEEVTCPSCRHNYNPKKGNVPQKGKFRCSCGQQDDIIASIRTLPQDERLPIQPYALQAYVSLGSDEQAHDGDAQGTFFDSESHTSSNGQAIRDAVKAAGLVLPDSGKFFKRFTASDMRRLQQTETLWEEHKHSLPYPKSTIQPGVETSRLLEHHYKNWADMFSARQLLALSTLLYGVAEEPNEQMQEMLLCVFSNTLEPNNLFTRYARRTTPGGEPAAGVFARHDFQLKITFIEQNVWGTISGRGVFTNNFEKLVEGKAYNLSPTDRSINDEKQTHVSSLERTTNGKALLYSQNSSEFEYGLGSFLVITDPPYVGNVNYAELADFFYVWLRLVLKGRYSHFAPEYTPKVEEIVENRSRGKTIQAFYQDLTDVFSRIHQTFPQHGLLVFTFHHTDQKGEIWEGLLKALCETKFEIVAIYPVHAESESSLHLMGKENISYDLIHVCRRRREDPQQRSWAGIRQELRRRAREELQGVERGTYGNQPLPEPDVRLICIGKCLELYSAHYGKVLDHENKPLPLHKALQDISAIVDQLVTKDRPLPSELEAVDGLSYVWLRVLAPIRNEVMMDAISKTARGMQVSIDDLKEAGLVVRGRTGRGRTYEVKQPTQRLGELVTKYQPGLKLRATQGELFTSEGHTIFYDIPLVDLIHLVIGLAQAGESVVPWLERFAGLRSQLGAALRYLRDLRADWKEPIERVLALIEGAPLIRQMENA